MPTDVFVNDAGAGFVGPFSETSMEDVRAYFDLNFFATAEGVKLALGVMERQGWGTVINESSLVGFLPSAYAPVYNSSKAALARLGAFSRLVLLVHQTDQG